MGSLLAILLSLLPGPQVQDGPTVEEVRFLNVGQVRVDESVLRAQLRTKVGRPYDPEATDKDIKDLARRFQVWAKATADLLPGGGVRITFELLDLSPVRRIVFEGARKTKEKDLRSALGLSERGVVPGGVLGTGQVYLLQQRLREYLQEKGFLYSEIEQRLETQADEQVLVFEVLEGPKVKVNDIVFQGLHRFKPRHLRSLMSTKESFWFFTHTYKPQAMDRDLVAVEKFLQDEGYLDARVALEGLRPLDLYEEVDVIVRIDQGQRYRIGTLEFAGNERFTDEELRALIRLRPGRVFRDADYQKDRREILKYYRNRGYIDATMPDPLEGYDLDQPIVNLTYRIREGEPKRIRDVRIVGNVNTADHVIRRELYLYPGDLINDQERLDAVDRIRATGFFADERGMPRAWITYEKTDDPRAADVVVRVEDGPTGLMNFLAGVGSGQGFFVGVNLDKQNFDIFDLPSSFWATIPEFLNQRAFHGGGQVLRIRANPGSQRADYSISFTEPYLTGPIENPVSLDVSVLYRELRLRQFDEDRFGQRVSIGKALSRDSGISLGIRNERVKIDNVDKPVPDYLAAEGTTNLRGLVGGWRWHKFDSLRNPTDGLRAELSTELLGGPLGADVDMVKTWFTTEWLLPIYENEQEQRHVLALRGVVAYAEPYGDTDDTPFFERFFAGGAGSLLQMRGFDFRGMGPHQLDEPVGGNGGVVVNADYIFPLHHYYDAQLQEDIPYLKGVLFVDQGMLEPEWEDLAHGKWRISVGAGIKLRIPIKILSAPLELYYGVPVQKAAEDEREGFTINFSTRF